VSEIDSICKRSSSDFSTLFLILPTSDPATKPDKDKGGKNSGQSCNDQKDIENQKFEHQMNIHVRLRTEDDS